MASQATFKLERLVDIGLGERSVGFDEACVTGVAVDSRDVSPGDLFLAFAGGNGHGLDHAAAAIQAGAAAIIHDRPGASPTRVPTACLAQLADNVGPIAARIYGQPSDDVQIAAVTGTDGKTSCAWLIAHAWAALGQECGYIGTLGAGRLSALKASRHTTPDATRLQAICATLRGHGVRRIALEASSHALDQQRLAALSVSTGVLTGIGRDHLDYHGTHAAYVAAKRRLFDRPELAAAVVNADDPVGNRWAGELASRLWVIAFGRDSAVTSHPQFVRIAAVQARIDGLRITIETHAGAARINSALVGEFNALNLAAVLGVLLAAGVDPAVATRALDGVPGVPGRMERVTTDNHQPMVVVDYAHTAGALATALTSLRPHAAGRVFCVFGAGGDRDRGKRAAMGRAVEDNAERFWITDDNPRHESPAAIVADIVADLRATTHRVIHDRRQAIENAIAEAVAGDVVLIAGKGHETTQQYGDTYREFDDRVVARAALEAA